MDTDWRSWDADTWRSWDAARLQDEVSPSSMVPGRDLSPWLRWYAESGDAAAAASPHGIEELTYGSHPDEVVSWASAGAAPAPLVVFIHGGYWVALSHRDALFAAPAVTRLGAHYASINYTLAPAATLEQIVDQCRRAIRFLLDEAGLPIDRRRIVLAGHSAGGHLAALCAEEVAGAHLLGFSGVYDLEPLLTTTVNQPLGLDRERALALSPLHRPVPPVPAALLVVGGSDPAHFRSLNARYAAHLRGAGVRATDLVVAPANHFDVIAELGRPGSAVTTWLCDALELDAHR